MSNPVDDYLESRSGMDKKAFFGRPQLRHAAGRVGIGALEAAGGAALLSLGGAAMKSFNAIKKKKDFGEMMEANPDLQEFQSQDPKRFQQHYNSLRSMNPQFARDPTVAGTYMRQMSMSPQTAGKVIVESISGARAMPSSPAQMAMEGYRPTDYMGMPPTSQLDVARLQSERMKAQKGGLEIGKLQREQQAAQQKEQETARQAQLFGQG